jgi:hypothetical protein
VEERWLCRTLLPLRSLPKGGADGLNQTGGMKTICFFDKAGGFDENLRKHPSALQTGDHYVLLSDLNMPGMSVTTHIEGGNTVPNGA